MPSYSGISPQLTANVQQARTNLELGKRLASLGLRVGLSPRVRLAGAQASGTAVSARRRLVDLDADLAAARGVREGCTTASEVLMASTASLSDSVASGAMTVDDAT
ncbi:MAG: hypothetical protein LBJ83_02140, partial [Oscillospiraceae bacterium]|nr:hypothetical protein [Oscillospiraceae bacterium]